MNGADWLILGVVALSCGIGFIRGFMREAIALATWLVGLWLAWTFSGALEPYLGGLLDQPGVKVWAARLIILVGVLLLGTLAGVFLAYVVRHSPFGTADRALGLLFGLLRGVIVVGLLALAGRLVELDQEAWWKASRLVPYASLVGEWLQQIFDSTNLADIAPAAKTLT